ncbi:Bug family tripartite tricarboxylate transporter substrate binding protein [Bordetella sp. 02P26C-1]|uniref:Bug family tripartite tricarboxylate transporter substrate binding protein n=1 Tax=Bordetella sp. 02P26C-1 TaxID=2683195 RepID=UPI00136663D1|nr:tripartite tricarboxylate transporter substrate binding protein [Bordetella sp. 02P26C-1]
MLRRSISGLLLSALIAVVPVGKALADNYPSKPVRIIVPYAPGGSSDSLARLLARYLGEKFNQTFVVENKSGGGTVIAAREVISSEPNGYTIALLDTSTPAVAPFLYKKQPFDPANLQPITRLASIPQGLLVPASSKLNTLDDFISYVKSNPGASYASFGNTSLSYFLFEDFLNKAGLKMTQVGYKGAAPALQDLIGDHIGIGFLDVSTSTPHIQAGKLKALAIVTEDRLNAVPSVPTFKESGFPDYYRTPWFGVFTRAGTPKQVVDKLNEAVMEFGKSELFAKWLRDNNLVLSLSDSTAAFESGIQADTQVYSTLIKQLGVSLD